MAVFRKAKVELEQTATMKPEEGYLAKYMVSLQEDLKKRSFVVDVRVSTSDGKAKPLYTYKFEITEIIGNTWIKPDGHPSNVSTYSRDPIEQVIKTHVKEYAKFYKTGWEPVNELLRRVNTDNFVEQSLQSGPKSQ